MRYSISKTFEKQFSKLPRKIKSKTIARLELFIVEPFHTSLNNHQLKGEWSDYRSINISGDIRAVYKDTDGSVAHFIAIGSHSELYE
ncbi:MAG: type II toxin-antitoxin system mRNA interferase toxin, RelE/StbE family [Candidatus Pacebacteria bacterium]|nr:type II toxin-antitoxin system mRNA interferase toxin, RelE/StbE family [Candidatus Paceibacterota bacterium]MBP9818501.1 type II toxin-antitoxin system mRNA interferase toxin, RelE/StbE family [Candidatus Paceibacterota bacterium]